MGQSGDFYIAWDGRRYEGMPPAGWFLAADNRWWPTPDIIEDGGDAGDQEVPITPAERAEPPKPPGRAESTERPDRTEPVPGQVPSSSSPPFAPPSPQATTRPRARPRNRPRRRYVRRIGQLLFLVFLFRGCLGVPDFSFSSEGIETASSAQVFEVAPPEDYEASINPCLGNAPTGLIRNRTDTRARFNVVVDVMTATGESETWTSPPTLTVNPGSLTSWTTVIPAGSAPATECSIAFVESKAIID